MLIQIMVGVNKFLRLRFSTAAGGSLGESRLGCLSTEIDWSNAAIR